MVLLSSLMGPQISNENPDEPKTSGANRHDKVKQNAQTTLLFHIGLSFHSRRRDLAPEILAARKLRPEQG